MDWNQAKRAAVEAKVESLRESSEGLDRDVARLIRAAPVVWSIGGCWALRSDGVVLDVLHDPPEEVANARPVSSPQLARGIHYQASLKFGLPLLAPQKPLQAIPCWSCGGAGHQAGLPKNFLCVCLGLGWQLPSEPKTVPYRP